MSPGRGSTPRQTDWQTVSLNVTQTQTLDRSWLPTSCRHLLTAFSSWFTCPEDGGDTFLRNVGSNHNYTAPDPRRRLSSYVWVAQTMWHSNNIFQSITFHLDTKFLGFCTLSIGRYLKKYDVSEIGCFRTKVNGGGETPTQLGPLERANLIDGNIQFRNVVFFKYRTMDKVQKPRNFVCYTPSSEPFRNYSIWMLWTSHCSSW
jgi:hypothetical protein